MIRGFKSSDCKVFARYPDSAKWSTVSKTDQDLFKNVRLNLKELSERFVAEEKSGLPQKAETSLPTPNGRSPNEIWCCVHPETVRNKSYGLQIALIISERGAEFCFCMGSGTSQIGDSAKKKEFEKELDIARQRLGSVSKEVISAVEISQKRKWFYRKSWLAEPNKTDFTSLADWLSYARTVEGSGASVSTYLSPVELQGLGTNVYEVFVETFRTFDPILSYVYAGISACKGWIFQANPDFYDVRAAVKKLTQICWLANQHADKMQKNDRVFLWESGSNAGIVAVAKIIETNAVQSAEEVKAEAAYTKVQEKFEGPLPRVRLEIVRVCNPYLPRQEIKAHPALQNLSILRSAMGTNFPVSDGEQQALDGLLNNISTSTQSKQICLIGTWKDFEESVDHVRKSIAEKGGWASPWSFHVREEAQSRLKCPFELYINAGNGRFPMRLRVHKYVTRSGKIGQVSPWPEITDPEWLDKTNENGKDSLVLNTWFFVDDLKLCEPPLSISDFKPVEGLSVEKSLRNQMAFGYAYRSLEDPMEALLEHTLLDRTLLEEIVTAVKQGSPQIVLAGPPGTSKTWIAEAIARYIADGETKVRLVQFHPNYSYEAFVQGLRPVAEGGGINFKMENGALLDLVRDMKEANEFGNAASLYVMVIDEMNRANLPRVFGELMYLFEYRDRKIRLQYSEEFMLPSNLRFIGTMNTADRSIRSIDIALRRRFDVFELRPDPGVLGRYFEKHPLNVPNLIEGFQRLNTQLEAALDRHHTIGHAFFMLPGITPTMLQAVWRRKIYPLIEEYFFDQPDIAKEYTFEKFWP